MFNRKLLKRIEKLEKQVLVPQKKVLRFVNKSPNANPYYAKTGDSGFDLRAWIDSNTEGVQFDNEKNEYYIEIQPNEVKLIHTGLYLDIPEYCEIQVRPRSGYALKVGITVNNAPGTVDVFYLGEVGVICLNPTKKPVRIANNDKVAQAVLCPVYSQLLVDLVQVDKIEKESKRGENGFGSTGM